MLWPPWPVWFDSKLIFYLVSPELCAPLALAFSLFLENAKHAPTSRLLHLLSPPSEVLFSQIPKWFSLLFTSSFLWNTDFSMSLFLKLQLLPNFPVSIPCLVFIVTAFIYNSFLLLLFFGPAIHHMESFIPNQCLNPCPHALWTQSLSHWTTREVSYLIFLICTFTFFISYFFTTTCNLPEGSYCLFYSLWYL